MSESAFDRFLTLWLDPEERERRRQRLAEQEANRTDPWRWYCRLCGAEGANADRTAMYDEAMAHISPGESCGCGLYVGSASTGRLLHVWTYG